MAMRLAILAVLALGLMAGSALAAKRVALVVGNAAYAALGTLANPTNDADDIASTLRGMGFEVTLVEDAAARPFAQALSNFATAADGADLALFYYSGHGLQYASENYLVPVDALLENRFSLTHETIALNDVLSAVSGAHTALLYIDACRSFPLAGTFFASANERVARVPGLAPVDDVHNTFIGFSASAGQTARDGAGRNSPFTSAMLQQLPTPGLDVSAMFGAVTAAVVSTTEGAQKPQSFSGISSDVTLVAGATAVPDSAAPPAEERAYRDAAAVGTIGAYRAFIARFPGGFYSELAREAVDKLGAPVAALPSASEEKPTPGQPALPAGLMEANLGYYGVVKESIGDWKIATSKQGCFMFTEATGVSPDGWLTYRPWLYFGTAANSALVQSALITASSSGGGDLFSGGTVAAAVTRDDGSSHPLSVHFIGSELRMVVPCAQASDGKYCLDDRAVPEMLAGTSLTVQGANAEGEPSSITYGIKGYADAARRINGLCKAKAGFLYGSAPTAPPAAPTAKVVTTPATPATPSVSLVGTWALHFDCPIIDFGDTVIISSATRSKVSGTSTSATGTGSFSGGTFDGHAFKLTASYVRSGKLYHQTWTGSVTADGNAMSGSLIGDDMNTTGGCTFTGKR